MGLLAYRFHQTLGRFFNYQRLGDEILSLILVMALAVAAYLVMIRWLGIKELNEVLESLKRRFRKAQN
jgi:hypothetical protein